MYFDNLQAMLFMEGHGVFVWAAYLVTLLVIAIVLIAPVRRRRRVLLQLGAELRREKGVPGARSQGDL
jgi:heme exporter protein D